MLVGENFFWKICLKTIILVPKSTKNQQKTDKNPTKKPTICRFLKAIRTDRSAFAKKAIYSASLASWLAEGVSATHSEWINGYLCVGWSVRPYSLKVRSEASRQNIINKFFLDFLNIFKNKTGRNLFFNMLNM